LHSNLERHRNLATSAVVVVRAVERLQFSAGFAPSVRLSTFFSSETDIDLTMEGYAELASVYSSYTGANSIPIAGFEYANYDDIRQRNTTQKTHSFWMSERFVLRMGYLGSVVVQPPTFEMR
jgi:hypothetical protein